MALRRITPVVTTGELCTLINDFNKRIGILNDKWLLPSPRRSPSLSLAHRRIIFFQVVLTFAQIVQRIFDVRNNFTNLNKIVADLRLVYTALFLLLDSRHRDLGFEVKDDAKKILVATLKLINQLVPPIPVPDPEPVPPTPPAPPPDMASMFDDIFSRIRNCKRVCVACLKAVCTVS